MMNEVWWKVAVVFCFQVSSGHVFGGTYKITINMSTWRSLPEFEPELPKCESDAVPLCQDRDKLREIRIACLCVLILYAYMYV